MTSTPYLRSSYDFIECTIGSQRHSLNETRRHCPWAIIATDRRISLLARTALYRRNGNHTELHACNAFVSILITCTSLMNQQTQFSIILLKARSPFHAIYLLKISLLFWVKSLQFSSLFTVSRSAKVYSTLSQFYIPIQIRCKSIISFILVSTLSVYFLRTALSTRCSL